MNYEKLESFLADIGAGTALALINNLPILLLNLAIVFGRIALEILIHRRNSRKNEKKNKDKG